ncbi:MAG: TIGR04190 family B12-binding domain/radical SAM domain protein [Chloroflexi bacterium]|nr:TIGR04190 family B12-binding domain/radical SAM domain protein [Chloroflexota bacterium]
MPQPDLILLHAPSVYDFRKEPILHGPVSDLVPSTAVFEMYPLGFASLTDYLERAGFRTRIVNLAVRMLNDRKFDAGRMIARLKAPLFGIDLHWLVHAHGAIEIARLVKHHHPQSKVVFGGLSSSYFYQELMQHPEVDFVIRGDTTEEPLRQLVEGVKQGRTLDTVPNLVWRDGTGTVRVNPFSHIPPNLDAVMSNHYASMIRSVIRYKDLASYIPFRNWMDYPITAVFTCHGCTENCVICGGSAFAFQNFYCRQDKVVYRAPQLVVRDIKQIARFIRGPIFILGDLRQHGEDYGYEVLRSIRQAGIKNRFILELFNPAPTGFLREAGECCPGFCLQISPETHDPEIRRAAGKHYSNEALEQTMGDALAAGCSRLDIFYIIGLPKQTPESVMESIDYYDYLLNKFDGDKRISLFIGPLAPFLDPGSLAFEQPERHGYRILFRTLDEHYKALLAPTWKYTLNYETRWMTRQQIVETTYEAIRRLNRVKVKYGIISPELAEAGERRLSAGLAMTRRIDEILSQDGDQKERIAGLKAEIDMINLLPASERHELRLPVGIFKLRIGRALWSWITGKW